jgi:hypothetical protein
VTGIGQGQSEGDVDAGENPDPVEIDAGEPPPPDEADADVGVVIDADVTPDAEVVVEPPDADVPVLDPTFTNDIYPLLQADGAGCGNCHSPGGIASQFPMTDGVENTYNRLQAEPGVIDLADPPASLLLRRPSGEGHPVKLFQNEQDTRYQLILRWIEDGALL